MNAARPPISTSTWQNLIEVNQRAAKMGWVEEGIFAPAVGPKYRPDTSTSLLYIGKSAGPLGGKVGSKYDQIESSKASVQWMTTFQNRSPFWQFVDQVDPTRETISWTNVCKMDLPGGRYPPRGIIWRAIREACVAALKEEIAALSPRVVVFVTANDYRTDIWSVLAELGYRRSSLAWDDGKTTAFVTNDGQTAIQTRHPQGWNSLERDRVITLIKSKLS